MAAAKARRRADNEPATETAPPVKGVTEELDPPEPAPEADAAPETVPAGTLVVEAVG